MSATSKTEEVQQESVVDDLATEEKTESVNDDKLAALKAKSQAKQQESKMAAKIVSGKERSLALGILGSGQAGSRIAEAFYKLGYAAVAINTAMQDLKYINIPDSNKLLLEYGLGGAAKEIEIGKAAADSHRGEIMQLVNERLGSAQVNVLCLSLGGGSGAGSCETLVDLLAEMGNLDDEEQEDGTGHVPERPGRGLQKGLPPSHRGDRCPRFRRDSPGV